MQLKTLKREDYDKGIHEKIDTYNKYINIVNLFGTSDQKQIIENDDSYQYVKNNDTYSLRYYIDRLNQTLRDTAIEAFLINNDVVQFLSSAAERKAALENLKKQRTAIDNYTRELETAVNIASSNKSYRGRISKTSRSLRGRDFIWNLAQMALVQARKGREPIARKYPFLVS